MSNVIPLLESDSSDIETVISVESVGSVESVESITATNQEIAGIDIYSTNDNSDEEADDDFPLPDFINLPPNSNVYVPKLNEWKELPRFQPIKVTVAKAKRSMWSQAQVEVETIKKNIAELNLPTDVVGTASTPLYKVYQFLFGTSSQICGTFCRTLGITKKDYLHFILTFILSCKNQQSVENMLSSMEINKKFIMPSDENKTVWTRIQNQSGSVKVDSFWRLIENATNQELKALFLSSDDEFPYLLGFDDDKLHFSYSKNTKMEGLSPQHHVKDNRRGLTLHTCAYPATCVPVAVSFQRLGESVQSTYARTMREIFGIGLSGKIQLRGVTLASDRGYWEKELLFSDFLEGGADIVGTVKRVSCRRLF